MKYCAKEFISYILCYDDGWEGDTGFSQKKLDFYEQLRWWIESNVPSMSSFAEWQVGMSAAFDIPPNFIKQVYSNEEVVTSQHASSLFGFDAPDGNICLLSDLLAHGVFDKYVSDPGGLELTNTINGDCDGLFSFVMATLLQNAKCDEDMIAFARAWVERSNIISKGRKPRRCR